MRRNGDQVRANVSLTDIASGRDVWSDRFDGDRTNLAALQDEITARLARSLNIELIQAESRRSEVDRSRNPDAMDFAMRGWAKLYGPQSKIQNDQAKDLFDSALRLDPDNLEAMVGKAQCLATGANNRWSASVTFPSETKPLLMSFGHSAANLSQISIHVPGSTARALFDRSRKTLS